MSEVQLGKNQETDFKRIQEWIKKLIPDSYDKFDLKGEYDSGLSYVENKTQLRTKLKIFLPTNLKEEAEKTLLDQERIEQEVIRKAEMEVLEYNQKVIYEVNKEVDKFYTPIYRAVDKIIKGYSNLTFVKGMGDIGKSFAIRRALIENNADYLEVSGEVTEAYLYRLLFENNGRVIWFKDVANLLNGLKSINILKAATESEEARVITKNNYSKQQEDLPNRFVCKCRFIFDYNNIQSTMRDDFEALMGRGDFIEFALSTKELEHIMRSIIKNPEEAEVTEFVITNFKGSGLVRLNLRTQWKAINTYKYAHAQGLEWKEEIRSELQRVSKVRALLYGLIGDEAVRKVELKRLLIKHELAPSIKNAERKIQEWIFIEELFEITPDERNGIVSLIPKELINRGVA